MISCADHSNVLWFKSGKIRLSMKSGGFSMNIRINVRFASNFLLPEVRLMFFGCHHGSNLEGRKYTSTWLSGVFSFGYRAIFRSIHGKQFWKDLGVQPVWLTHILPADIPEEAILSEMCQTFCPKWSKTYPYFDQDTAGCRHGAPGDAMGSPENILKIQVCQQIPCEPGCPRFVLLQKQTKYRRIEILIMAAARSTKNGKAVETPKNEIRPTS